MPEPLVSIIIPTYNRAHLIWETLNSVLAQTYQNWECIVVDDGSTDNTASVMAEYIEKDARFRYLYRPVGRLKGANACRNFGFENSKGDFLIFLDSDDLLEPNCLGNRCVKISQDISYISDSVNVYKMGLVRYGKKTEEVFNREFDGEKEYLEQFLKISPPWTITCVFWPSILFENIGKFDEKFGRLQDVDIHTKLLLFGVRINLVSIVDCWYRILDNLEDYLTEEKLPTIIQSHILYIEKYYRYKDTRLLDESEINSYLRKSYLRVLKKFVFREKVISFKQTNALNERFGILSSKKSRMIQLLALYHKLGIHNRFGYSRIRNLIFNA